MLRCVKVNTLGRLCDDNLERSYDHFTTTNIYFIGAAYNFYFLIIYKPSSLIISPRTFSTQLGAGTAWFCLSQYAIPFCTLSPGPSKNKNQSFRAWLMKLLEEESDDLKFPSEDVNVNSTSIEEIPDPVPPSRKGKGTPKLDFPLGL